MKIFSSIISLLLLPMMAMAGEITPQEISVAGFFPLDDSGRVVYDFNNGWRYHLGDVADGASTTLDDSSWEVVSTPHTVELLPAEGGGCRNYQGKAWYRKHFVMPEDTKGKDVTLHFEAVMGKQKFYVNGREVKENFGGYLPVTISLTEAGVKPGEECVVAVMADNSDDKTFLPASPNIRLTSPIMAVSTVMCG